MTQIPTGATVRRWRYVVLVGLRVLMFLLGAFAVFQLYLMAASAVQQMILGSSMGLSIFNVLWVLLPLIGAIGLRLLEKRLIAFLAPLPSRGCPQCGYSLVNLRSPICPECGSDVNVPNV